MMSFWHHPRSRMTWVISSVNECWVYYSRSGCSRAFAVSRRLHCGRHCTSPVRCGDTDWHWLNSGIEWTWHWLRGYWISCTGVIFQSWGSVSEGRRGRNLFLFNILLFCRWRGRMSDPSRNVQWLRRSDMVSLSACHWKSSDPVQSTSDQQDTVLYAVHDHTARAHGTTSAPVSTDTATDLPEGDQGHCRTG